VPRYEKLGLAACRFAYDSRRTLSGQRRSQQADERGPRFVVPFGVQAAPDFGMQFKAFRQHGLQPSGRYHPFIEPIKPPPSPQLGSGQQ
jgi:hypothetical protein